MHRFYLPTVTKEQEPTKITGDEFRHLANVLRLKAGDKVYLFDGQGQEYEATIQEITKDAAYLELGEQLTESRESPVELYLVQGIAKGDKMDFVIQKATELGVKGIIPLEAKRSVVRLAGGKKADKQQRWQKVALEATKQCRRSFIPQVSLPQGLNEFLATLPQERLVLIPWEEGGRSLKTVLTDSEIIKKQPVPVYLLIGPEGGWDETEVELARSKGAIPVTLGPRILRTETAGLATIAAIMYQWGGLG